MARYDFVNDEGNPVEQEILKEESFETSQMEIERKILNKIKRGLGFLEGWHLCPICNVVFGLERGEKGLCPNCGSQFLNERGDLIFKGLSKEKEEEREEEKEEGEGGEIDANLLFEPVIIRGGSFMSPENEEVDVKKIGTEDCPYCEKSVDWDKIEPHYGFFGVVKKCPECGGQSYALNEDERIWLRRNIDRDNEIGLFGGVAFGGEEEED